MAFAESGQSGEQAPSGKTVLQLLRGKNKLQQYKKKRRRETMGDKGIWEKLDKKTIKDCTTPT